MTKLPVSVWCSLEFFWITVLGYGIYGIELIIGSFVGLCYGVRHWYKGLGEMVLVTTTSFKSEFKDRSIMKTLELVLINEFVVPYSLLRDSVSHVVGSKRFSAGSVLVGFCPSKCFWGLLGRYRAAGAVCLLFPLALSLIMLMACQHDGFTLSLLDSLFSKGLCMVKSIPAKCRLGFSRVLKGAIDKVICNPDDISCWVSLLVLPLFLLKTFCPRSNLECKSANKRQRQEESITNAINSWGVPGGSLQLVRETLAESVSPMLDRDEEDLDLSVAPYNDATLQELKAKHPFKSATSLADTPFNYYQLIASQALVLARIKNFPRGTSCGRDGLRAQHLMDCLIGVAIAISDELVSSITQVVNLFLAGKYPMRLGEYIASAPLTPLVKPGGGILPIAVGTVWKRLVSKVSAIMVVHSLDGYLDDLQFGVGVSGGGEAILHAVNRLVEDHGDEVAFSLLLVDFQNAFNLVDRKFMLEEVRPRCPANSRWVEFCYSSPARLY
ncbi:hypothetical protein Tco_1227592 [Tanacetum coccineum]